MRQALSSDDAFLLKPSPLAACYGMNDATILPGSAASLLYPFRVARISRLISNLNTTAKPPCWQVNFGVIRGSGLRRPISSPYVQNATPFGVASRCPALGTGLPNFLWAVAYATAPYSDFSRWSSLLRAASLAVALAGCLLFFGLAWLFPSSRFITGTYL